MALAHEWLDGPAGSEKTFVAMAAAFPDADLYALTVEPGLALDFGGRAIRRTLLDRTDWSRRHRELTLPLMPLAWRALPTPDYDVVLTSSHACAKGFPAARASLHLCYCYTPMRYAWLPNADVRNGRAPRLTRAGLSLLRRWDRGTVSGVDSFAAISTAVQGRIREFYGRDARVIHPPVDTGYYTPGPDGRVREGVLAVSRFVPYKRLDLAIRAAARVGVPLVVAGSGPDEGRLRALAAACGGAVRFLVAPSDAVLRQEYRRAAALLFCADEDFGIVGVEAQACGTPVVGLARGGTLDTVVDGVTGALVAQQEEDAFAEALGRLLADPPSPGDCTRHAARFSTKRFVRELQQWRREMEGDAGAGVAAA